MVIRNPLTAKLDPGILPFPSQSCLQSKFKIAVLFSSTKKFVVGDLVNKRPCDDGRVFDAEHLQIPLPAVECLTIKQGHKPGFLLDLIRHHKIDQNHSREQYDEG